MWRLVESGFMAEMILREGAGCGRAPKKLDRWVTPTVRRYIDHLEEGTVTRNPNGCGAGWCRSLAATGGNQ